jgi:hypothetical protein
MFLKFLIKSQHTCIFFQYEYYIFIYLISIHIFNSRHNSVSYSMNPNYQFKHPRRILTSLPDDGPMRPKHVAGNKYSIVKY